MKKCACVGCESNVLGVLVFSIKPGMPICKGHLGLCVDVFESALAFVEKEGWAVNGTYTIKGGQRGSMQNSSG